jgi:hypothetical protein
MRKLETADVFSFCRCLKKLGLQEQYRTLATEANNVEDVARLGVDFFWGLFDAATEKSGEKEIYTFFAGPFEMTPAEVQHLPFPQLIDNLQQLAEENNLGVFFKYAARLMK